MRSIVSLLACTLSLSAQMVSSPEKEAALGRLMAGEIRSNSSVIVDPAVRAYVSRLATKLAGPNVLLPLEVLDRDNGVTHEPLWLPGGYLFVSAELILTARDESEFAGMFAHALAHEINRDNMRMTTVVPGAIPLIFMGGEMMLDTTHTRPFEREADAMAVRMMANVGYDAEALNRYLGRTTPGDTERIEALRKAIADLAPQTSPVVDSSEFQGIREKLTPQRAGRNYAFPPTLRRSYEQ